MVDPTNEATPPLDPGDAYARPVEEVAAALEVDPTIGLTDAIAAARRERFGVNELEAGDHPTLLAAVREAVTEPFVILLFVAGTLAALLGEVRDGLLILVGLLPIVGADVITDYRSERALASLREAAAPRARTRRERDVREILAAALVPGDVVLIRSGEIVPADLRLSRVDSLLVDRSTLTGESVPELASTMPDAPDASVADRRSIAFAGTAVVGGRGEGIVVATGGRTELGRIAGHLATIVRRRSPLQRELDRLVRILLVVAVGLVIVTVSATLLRGGALGAAVLAGVSAAIAAIPEEPPVLLAVILGLGAYRLLRRGVLVRRLSAEETLGSVDLILTDKTGTLTENRLALSAVLTPSGVVADAGERARLVGAGLRAEEDAWHIGAGSPPGAFTGALMGASGSDETDGHGSAVRLDPAELVSAAGPAEGRPYSVTWSRRDGHLEGAAIGAPEAVLSLQLAADAPGEAWRSLVEREAAGGGRLLLLALASEPDAWRPVAVFAFADSLREGVPEALRVAAAAGIQTVVVTGDHPATAAAIARAAGMSVAHVLRGTDMAAWDDARLARELGTLSVVARAVPEDKLRLVDVARASGRTVAVTGDGVNDAPALQHADVAVAMGSGTAVARDASDLVLGDDSFATLMYGLREGRRIVTNVQKGLVFLISTHVALLGFILIATIAGFSQPLLPIQILWMELFIDLSTSVAFEREPEEPGAMTRPPRPRGTPLLTRPILIGITGAGGFSAVAALAVMLMHGGTSADVRWLAFTTLVVAQVVRAYANRSLATPVTALRPNALLGGACLLVLIVQVAIPYIPPLAEAFRATPIVASDWFLVAIIALAPAVLAEVVRRLTGRDWVA